MIALALLVAPDAPAVLRQALAQARTEKKNVLLDFRASWCPWRLRMDRLLKADPAFARAYVVVPITVRERDSRKAEENGGWEKVMARYRGGGIQDIPYLVWIDPNGVRLADSYAKDGPLPSNAGYPQTAAETNAFVRTLLRTGRFSQADATWIRRSLRPAVKS